VCQTLCFAGFQVGVQIKVQILNRRIDASALLMVRRTTELDPTLGGLGGKVMTP